MKPLPQWGFTPYLIFIFVLFFFSVLFTNPIGDFPIGDDWQYGYPVKTWVENGAMEFKGIFAPNVLLQVAFGYLFCKIGGSFDFTWLRLSTLVLGILGIFYFFKIVKQTGATNITAFFIATSLLFSPLFYYLSFTFFTDVPFLALCIVSISCFFKYIEFGKTKYMVWAVFLVCRKFLYPTAGAFVDSCLWHFYYFRKTVFEKIIAVFFVLFFSRYCYIF